MSASSMAVIENDGSMAASTCRRLPAIAAAMALNDQSLDVRQRGRAAPQHFDFMAGDVDFA
jgi:hypothetical protein